MTNFHLKPAHTLLASQPWQEKKEQRKQQLAAVRRRRRMIYELMRKMQTR